MNKPKFKIGDIVATHQVLFMVAAKIEEIVIAEKAVIYRIRYRDNGWEYKIEAALMSYFEEDEHAESAS